MWMYVGGLFSGFGMVKLDCKSGLADIENVYSLGLKYAVIASYQSYF